MKQKEETTTTTHHTQTRKQKGYQTNKLKLRFMNMHMEKSTQIKTSESVRKCMSC